MQYDFSSMGWIGLLVSIVLPIAVGLVTRRMDKGRVKAVLLLFLSAVTGFLVELRDAGAGYDVENAVMNSLVGFGVAVAMHFGLWKPTGVSEKAQKTLVTDKVRGEHAA